MHSARSSPKANVQKVGSAKLAGVRVSAGGVHGYDARPAVGFLDLGARPAGESFLRASVVADAFNAGVLLKKSGGVELRGNVVVNTLGSSFRSHSNGNSFVDNLALGAVSRLTYRGRETRSTLKNVEWRDYLANYEFDESLPCTCPSPDTAALAACSCASGGAGSNGGSVVTGNAAAGSERLGFKYSVPPALCGGEGGGAFGGNVAHSVLLGVAVHFSRPAACVLIRDVTVYRAWTFGVWGSAEYDETRLEGVAVADSKVALTWNAAGPSALAHKLAQPPRLVQLTDSLLLGRSAGNPECPAACLAAGQSASTCIGRPAKRDKWAWAEARGQAALMLATFSSGIAGMVPKKKPWRSLQAAYPSLAGEVRVRNSSLANFVGSPCGVPSVVLEGNAAVPDATHPHYFSQMVVENHDRLALLHPPSRGWISIDDCVAMDCDGPRHVLLHDVDGTLTGGGVAASISARAEYMNEFRADGKTPTAYAIPAKMLYDATPYGRPHPAEGSTPLSEAEIVTKGWGVYRPGCEEKREWNGWLCNSTDARLARLIIESLDADSETRSLVPVAIASGGYVDLLNGGQDHGWCFGYTCLKRLSTFHATVASNVTYDLAFAGTNPQSLRFAMPTDPEVRVMLAVWYSSPNKLQVFLGGVVQPDLNPIPYGDALVRPDLATSPCGANAFIGDENKLLLLVCGGDAALEVRTVPIIVLSIGIEVTIDEFFAAETVARNIISLLGISPDRVRVVSASADGGRRLSSGAVSVLLEVSAADKCDGIDCGAQGSCSEGTCICKTGCATPLGCDGGHCECSVCGEGGGEGGNEGGGCRLGEFLAPSGCEACDESCGTCTGGSNWDCTSCRYGYRLEKGGCLAAAINPARAYRNDPTALFAELSSVAADVAERAERGTLDVGFALTAVGIAMPRPLPAGSNDTAASASLSRTATSERQRVLVGGRAAWSGAFTLEFNGETTAALDVAVVDAEGVKVALQALLTVGSVAVNLSRSEGGSDGGSEVVLEVEFTGEGEPLNMGSLPLLVLNASGVAGLQHAAVTLDRRGASPADYALAEQRITLDASSDAALATLGGAFTLAFAGESTRPIPPRASAVEVREALVELSTVGDVEVFLSADVDDGFEPISGQRAWTVRFYPGRLHLGSIDRLQANSSGLVSRLRKRRLQGGAQVLVEHVAIGASPFDDATVAPPPPPAAPGSGGDIVAVPFAPVVHVCGDGVLSTAEGCDDNNTASADGCDSSCRIEPGWRCVGSLGARSVCSTVCGDGRRVGPEACDDNNTWSSDGCSEACEVEPGFFCIPGPSGAGGAATPDVCSTPCGTKPCLCVLAAGAPLDAQELGLSLVAQIAAELPAAERPARLITLTVYDAESGSGEGAGGEGASGGEVVLVVAANDTSTGWSEALPSSTLTSRVQMVSTDGSDYGGVLDTVTDGAAFGDALAHQLLIPNSSLVVQLPCTTFPPSPPPAPPSPPPPMPPPPSVPPHQPPMLPPPRLPPLASPPGVGSHSASDSLSAGLMAAIIVLAAVSCCCCLGALLTLLARRRRQARHESKTAPSPRISAGGSVREFFKRSSSYRLSSADPAPSFSALPDVAADDAQVSASADGSAEPKRRPAPCAYQPQRTAPPEPEPEPEPDPTLSAGEAATARVETGSHRSRVDPEMAENSAPSMAASAAGVALTKPAPEEARATAQAAALAPEPEPALEPSGYRHWSSYPAPLGAAADASRREITAGVVDTSASMPSSKPLVAAAEEASGPLLPPAAAGTPPPQPVWTWAPQPVRAWAPQPPQPPAPPADLEAEEMSALEDRQAKVANLGRMPSYTVVSHAPQASPTSRWASEVTPDQAALRAERAPPGLATRPSLTRLESLSSRSEM